MRNCDDSPTCPVKSTGQGNFCFLAEISPRDKRWDEIRGYADEIAKLYKNTRYSKYADRISGCSRRLNFGTVRDADTGETRLKLRLALFCRVPRCPVCQWRRSLMWRAKAFKILPKLFENYPDARYLFLTLTVRNCDLTDLRSTLADMNKAWERLFKRKYFPAIGWLKSVEVTRSEDDTAHPHFHVLLMVKPSYFQGKYYLSQKAWTELWQKSMRIDYTPIVHIQVVKDNISNNIGEIGNESKSNNCNNSIINAVLETIKYSVKPSDLVKMSRSKSRIVSNQDWLTELTSQLYKTKSLATGGIFKEYFKELEEEPDDLINADDLPDTEEGTKSLDLMFKWSEFKKRYSIGYEI